MFYLLPPPPSPLSAQGTHQLSHSWAFEDLQSVGHIHLVDGIQERLGVLRLIVLSIRPVMQNNKGGNHSKQARLGAPLALALVNFTGHNQI